MPAGTLLEYGFNMALWYKWLEYGIDACSISSCGIMATSMPRDEIEHAPMHIGETLVCIDALEDWDLPN